MHIFVTMSTSLCIPLHGLTSNPLLFCFAFVVVGVVVDVVVGGGVVVAVVVVCLFVCLF